MNNAIFFNELKKKLICKEYQIALPPFILLMNNWSYINE